MSIILKSATPIGVGAKIVDIEVDPVRRLPAVVIVGLPAMAVRETAERVRSAITVSGYEMPKQRVIVNLAPADLRKQGSHFDLPIAMGILVASDQVDRIKDVAFIGELGLNGDIRPVRSVLPMLWSLAEAGISRAVIPEGNANEGAAFMAASEMKVCCAKDLVQIVHWTLDEIPLPTAESLFQPDHGPGADLLSMDDIQGMVEVKASLQAAADRREPVLLLGQPGCGKTMLAARAPGLLPDLTSTERLEAMRIRSAAGLLEPGADVLGMTRPFRAPHHTVSIAGMIGDAHGCHPGEATLAHQGVLFLDELPEFSAHVIEMLGRVVRDQVVTINRASGTVRMPAWFWLVAAANPCPCGGGPKCRCPEDLVRRHRARIEKFCEVLNIETIIKIEKEGC